MSALPFREEAPQTFLIKLYNTPYTLDPIQDRLASQGYHVQSVTSYEAAVAAAHEHRPALIVVYDDPEAGIDARQWLEKQHYDRFGWMATTPLLILADSARIPDLRIEELPDRVIIIPRRADTLNHLTRIVKRVIHLWNLEDITAE